ncbi:hypothetical protein BGZ90_012214 [Linnemannia elongata]|nr:hypothetical protein BGZ90_012214 [Linnemannia elongata]
MPSSSFWFLALVGTPILACSFLKEYTFTYILVLLTTGLLLNCCSFWFLALAGIPIFACSSLKEHTFTYVLVLFTTELLSYFSFWFLALVGTPILAYSSLNEYTFTYILVLLTANLLRSSCSDNYPHYQASPYQGTHYRTVTSLKPSYDPLYNNSMQWHPVLGYHPVYTLPPPKYDESFPSVDDFVASDDDIRTRYNDPYSRCDVPTQNNTRKPSPLPSSVYEHSLDPQTYCGQGLHEHVARHAVDRYQYHRGLSGASSSSYVIRDQTRCVLGWFTCKYPYCPSLNQRKDQRTWRSGSICVRVLVSCNDKYQTIIHAQQCNACDQFVQPVIDGDVYARKIVSALDLWTGRRAREAPNTDFVKTSPHDCARCYGCQKGICPRRE